MKKQKPQKLGVIKYTFLDSKYVQWVNKWNIWCFSMCLTLCYSLVSQWSQGRHGFLCLRHGDMLTLNGYIQGRPVNLTGAGRAGGLARVQVWVSFEEGRNWGTLTCRENCRRYWKEVRKRISDTVHRPLRWQPHQLLLFQNVLQSLSFSLPACRQQVPLLLFNNWRSWVVEHVHALPRAAQNFD